MISQEKATKLGEACLNEMYKKSFPSVAWKDIKKKYSGTKTQFFLKHVISIKDYEKIKTKYEKKLGKFWGRGLDWLLFDYSPHLKDEDVLKKAGK